MLTNNTNNYPFGMIMPGRSYTSQSYRFGFNGMEKDDEVKGSGNSLDFGARIYDSRLGRFLSMDRYDIKFPSNSPYIFANNTPIWGIDINGDSLYIGGNIFEAIEDIFSIIKSPEFKASLVITEDGKILTSLTRKALMEMNISDPVDLLIYQLITSPHLNLYEVEGDVLKGGSNNAPQKDFKYARDIYVPSKGKFDTYRTMATRKNEIYEKNSEGKKTLKPRTSLIIHELYEMNKMSEGVPYIYSTDDEYPGTGAHGMSIEFQKSVGDSRIGENPGVQTEYHEKDN